MARILRQDAERLLGDVPDDKAFWVCDGRSLKSMRDLQWALDQMGEETFHTHSNGEKSDFSIWVKDVIGDEKLARDLSKSTTPAMAAKNVSSRIAFLDGKVV